MQRTGRGPTQEWGNDIVSLSESEPSYASLCKSLWYVWTNIGQAANSTGPRKVRSVLFVSRVHPLWKVQARSGSFEKQAFVMSQRALRVSVWWQRHQSQARPWFFQATLHYFHPRDHPLVFKQLCSRGTDNFIWSICSIRVWDGDQEEDRWSLDCGRFPNQMSWSNPKRFPVCDPNYIRLWI